MPTLVLTRTPFALFLDRALVPFFCVLLAMVLVVAAWRYATTIYAPQSAVIALLVATAAVLLGVAWALAKYAPWPVAIKVSETGAVTVVTTRGETTIPAGDAYGVIVVRFGIALKYRGADEHDAWIGISSGYIDEADNHLSGYALIDRINTAIGAEAANMGRTSEAFNWTMLRAFLVLLGFLILIIGAIAAMRIASGK